MKKFEDNWFECDEYMIKTTINRCVRCCKKADAKKCAMEKFKVDKQIETEVQRIRDLEKEKCSKCGEYLVSSLYFAFCPNCGFADDDENEEM